MFGYININPDELSDESKKIYQAYYCGLCRKLKTNCGAKGQMLLNYDMTFLVVLLTGLYELDNDSEEFKCGLHPTQKRSVNFNAATSYAADMNVVLAYHNLIDDWKDDRSYSKIAFAKMIENDYRRVADQYPRQVEAVERYMEQTAVCEAAGESNIDVIAGLTGDMLGEIFCWRTDEWSEELRTMGFYMGKFVYLMDAYEDYESDIKKKQYNPLCYLKYQDEKEFETLCKLLLTSMISECAKSFERLPILMHADILRNVLYSGVWSRYEYLQLKKQKKSKRENKIRNKKQHD